MLKVRKNYMKQMTVSLRSNREVSTFAASAVPPSDIIKYITPLLQTFQYCNWHPFTELSEDFTI